LRILLGFSLLFIGMHVHLWCGIVKARRRKSWPMWDY
jgi:hypothetical protein